MREQLSFVRDKSRREALEHTVATSLQNNKIVRTTMAPSQLKNHMTQNEKKPTFTSRQLTKIVADNSSQVSSIRGSSFGGPMQKWIQSRILHGDDPKTSKLSVVIKVINVMLNPFKLSNA